MVFKMKKLFIFQDKIALKSFSTIFVLWYLEIFWFFIITNKILDHSFQTRFGGRPNPRSGSRVLTGSPNLPGQFFFLKKNQNDVVLVKKSERIVTGFFDRVLPGQPVGYAEFFLPLFFLKPSPAPAPDQPARPYRILKLCSQCYIN